MLHVLNFPPSQHTCGMRGTSPCFHLLIPENPCSTGTSLGVGFSLDSTSLLPILGFVQFQWLRVRSPRWGWHEACPAGISNFGKFVCKGILAGVFPRTLPHPLGPNSFPKDVPRAWWWQSGLTCSLNFPPFPPQVQGILLSSCPGTEQNS